MPTLTDRFCTFLRLFPGAEEIDAIALTPEQKLLKLRNADFLFENRSIICEVKTLKNDPTHKLESAMAKHGIHPSQLTTGRHIVEDLFAKLPKGRNLYRRVVKGITKSIDKGLDDATRQIGETKTLFEITSADGLVIVLNENIQLLGQVFFEERLRLALQKTTPDGNPYHGNITYVLLIIEANAVTSDDGKNWVVNTYYDNPAVKERHELKAFIHHLAEAWAAHNGQAFSTADGDAELYALMNSSKLAVYIK